MPVKLQFLNWFTAQPLQSACSASAIFLLKSQAIIFDFVIHQFFKQTSVYIFHDFQYSSVHLFHSKFVTPKGSKNLIYF